MLRNKIKPVVKYAVVLMTTVSFASFILEEAIQTMCFGLWILKDEHDVRNEYLLRIYPFARGIQIAYWCLLPVNPVTGWVYVVYGKATMLYLRAQMSVAEAQMEE